MLYLALLPVLIWLYLMLARGGFWRVGRLLSTDAAVPGAADRVVAVIPARNEASVVGLAVQSLLAQHYAGELHIVVVDDASSDGTADVVGAVAAQAGAVERVTVLRGSGPEPGWSGKVCAMARGVATAALRQPDYLLFTDADIHHEPDHVARLVANAQRLDADLLSFMVQLTVSNAAERWLIPAFVFFFLKLYPPAWIARRGAATAGAAGGCMLVRPAALERSGGLEAIHSQIIDDCALARSIKRAGGRVCLGLTRRARSLRPYGSVAEIGRMISRTAFNQLGHSWLLLLGTLVGLVATYLLPPVLLFSGSPTGIVGGACAWALMSLCYRPMVRFYGLNAWWALTLPAAAAYYAGATVYSAWQYQIGRGGQWKGRAQDSQG
ncbi:MAG TPA: glycosyltransferase [Steroidobacteraceae bacterium]|jgi:hopene-associated glycosyltransferase HpnB